MARFTALAALVLVGAASPAFAADDGFLTFWKSFATAVGKDDTKALAGMIALGPELGDNGGSFAKFHAGDLDRKTRACLARTKPVRSVDGQGRVSYDAFCGQVIYIFEKTAAGWKMDGIGADD